MNIRSLFQQHVGQTSDAPLALHIVKAEGCYLIDVEGKKYLDLIGGISVCNVGHGHPKVIDAIKEQADKYLHIMVYGELIESPQVAYATKLASLLPASLQSVFFTASGTEATEGAMKLAKRFTGRAEIICAEKAYHGSTQGSLSLIGDDYWQKAYRPLLPGIQKITVNNFESIDRITDRTAAVILETIQAEAGVNIPKKEWLQAVRAKCSETGALLILDEIQCGFGRNGSLWAFDQFDVVPDILLLGKALGGGMPLGAFVSSNAIMSVLTHNPVLGHINTFGGHPVSCAAGLAALDVLESENLVEQVNEKAKLFLDLLKHVSIEKVQAKGLMIAVHFSSFEINKKIIDALIAKGIFTDWFLFAPQALRIAPPLTISAEQIRYACETIITTLNELG